MMWILRSYRWRRRLATTAIVLVVAGTLTYLGIRYSTPGVEDEPLEAGPPAEIYREPEQVPLTDRTRRQLRVTLAKFISTAVARRRVAESWDVTGPGLRQDLSRREWATGAIPVQPYPAGRRGLGKWEVVQYSYPNRVGLEVLLWPRRGSGERPLSVEVDLVRGRNGRWLVDYWLAVKQRGGAEEPAPAAAQGKRRGKDRRGEVPQRTAAPREDDRLGEVRSRANPLWWALPAAIIALIVIVPVAVALVHWRRNKRAEAMYYGNR
jgi:hypothetical protein